MFDHYQDAPPESRASRAGPLLLATVAMLGATALLIVGSVTVLRLLGYKFRPDPVEISYDPYEDGSTLEQLIGGDRPIDLAPIPDTGAAGAGDAVEPGQGDADEAAPPDDASGVR